MQDRYAGDVGDYIKLSLLRHLSVGKKLGVAWYLFPNENHNDDGRHINYLSRPANWKHFDPELFEMLSGVVQNCRSVAAIEASELLQATFHSQPIVREQNDPTPRHSFRERWFQTALSELADCEIVFADPDNGLVDDAPSRRRASKFGKRLPLAEALAWSQNRCAIVYHHNSRFKGGHDKEVDHWLQQLGPEAFAIRANAYSCRTFFVINPDSEVRNRAVNFCRHWATAKVRMHR